jgi:hypothetical protein
MLVKTGRSVPTFQRKTLFRKRVCLDCDCLLSQVFIFALTVPVARVSFCVNPQFRLYDIHSFVSYLAKSALRHLYEDQTIALRFENHVKQVGALSGENVQLLKNVMHIVTCPGLRN